MNKLAMSLTLLLLMLFATACADAGQPANLDRNALPANVQRFSGAAAPGNLDALKAQLPAEYAGLVDEYAGQLEALKGQLPDDYAGLVDMYASDLDGLKSQLPADYASLVDEYAAKLEGIKAQLPPEYAALVDKYAGDLDALPVSAGPRALTKLPRPKRPGNAAAAGNAPAPKVLQNFPPVTMPKAVTRFPNFPDHKAFTNPPTASGSRATTRGKPWTRVPTGARPGVMSAQPPVSRPEITRPQRPEKPNVSLPGRKDGKRRNWPQVTNPPFPKRPPIKITPVPYPEAHPGWTPRNANRADDPASRINLGRNNGWRKAARPNKDIPRAGF